MSRTVQTLFWSLVATTTCLFPQQVEAQARFGVIIGNGGGVRIGVGNGYYGPGYGAGYGPGYGQGYGYRGYGAGPVGVGIAPVAPLSPRPLYVPPQQPLYTPQPQTLAQQQAPTSPTPIADGGEIIIFNPASTGQDVRYLLNGQLYTMPAGTKQSLTNDRTWTIQYEGTPGQVTSYSLVAAKYKFKPTDTGVGLFQTQDTPESTLTQGAPGLPPAPQPDTTPVPNPPEAPIPDLDATVIPSRPSLKTTP